MKYWLFASLLLPALSVAEPDYQVPDNWPSLIEQVTYSDPETLKGLPENIFSFGLILDGDHTSQLNNALRFSLLKATSQTLDVLSIIDNHDGGENSSLIQRFNTESVCSPSLGFLYDKLSVLRYYQQVSLVLKNSKHKNSKLCLWLMSETMEEFNYEEKRGTMKWGTLTYPAP